jgi:hypothetical protein
MKRLVSTFPIGTRAVVALSHWSVVASRRRSPHSIRHREVRPSGAQSAP